MGRVILIIAGTISLGLGILGMFVPLLPTVPFLLLTASCYMKSSDKLYDRLISHRILGKIITDYRENKTIPLKIKISSLTLLWLSIIISAFVFVDLIWVRILLFVIAAGVTAHILSYKSGK
ncbi:MAG: YbaN family protein [Bacteroidales bacterium]|jgi:uncharacterized membrane protein YbaN (DUF454 family)|nr:YbaN family protein [Bacteroidales bacterium]